ncbi:hypothetical protein B4U79_18179 [Dinothrombium tinctorium]|uniref:Insulin-like domain-containing protein n=1 Tax=Dinothrombium tinctorium TaxID=1965070 RepID=A0A3S3NS31_9ACAR|nr:hypothetical protein B4U79_18179 [Dinothrombium tinctorium]
MIYKLIAINLLFALFSVPTECRDIRACGQKLAKIIKLVCSPSSNPVITVDEKTSEETSNNRESSLVSECCIKECTMKTLRAYCLN